MLFCSLAPPAHRSPPRPDIRASRFRPDLSPVCTTRTRRNTLTVPPLPAQPGANPRFCASLTPLSRPPTSAVQHPIFQSSTPSVRRSSVPFVLTRPSKEKRICPNQARDEPSGRMPAAAPPRDAPSAIREDVHGDFLEQARARADQASGERRISLSGAHSNGLQW